jgi:hypothetical protein
MYNAEITLPREGLLRFLSEQDNGTELLRNFVEEFYRWEWQFEECPSCGDERPINDSKCLLCGAEVKRTFVVTFTFSVTVKAVNESEAENKAGDTCNVDVSEDDDIEYGYDLEVADTSDAF